MGVNWNVVVLVGVNWTGIVLVGVNWIGVHASEWDQSCVDGI